MKKKSWDAILNTFQIESEALAKMPEVLDRKQYREAIELLKNAERIGCSGCGHSGIACAHFAHSLCCIERPARFLSPSEALHGAIGFLRQNDVLIIASRGGETEELIPVERIAKENRVSIIAITENNSSLLARDADVVLHMTVTKECDKFNSQGTTSFIVLSAIFDALQTSLIEEMGYKNEKFAIIHPGGAVGKRLNNPQKYLFRNESDAKDDK